MVGVVLHSLLMIALSFLKVVLPLHPFILLYPKYEKILPATSYPLLNLLLLFSVCGLFFCNGNRVLKSVTLLLIICLCTIGHRNDKGFYNSNKVKIAVVQVGLYFEKGGNTTDFFNDFMGFLDQNTDVNFIVFSENNVFSFKTDFNKKLSEKLLEDLNLTDLKTRKPIFLSFNGYKNFNNVVTLYMYKDKVVLNQKRALIPFVEQPGIFNSKSDIKSEYYQVYDGYINKSFEFEGGAVSTFICYDALFPEFKSNLSEIILIQSNYKLLDKGFGYDRLKYLATYLAKFLNGMQSKVVINVQNYGGTVVLYNDWTVDEELYDKSKKNPFFIIDLDNKSNGFR